MKMKKARTHNAFPRIRGGDPIIDYATGVTAALFPAYAGVIPTCPEAGTPKKAFPRIRGGDPINRVYDELLENFSPHARG